MKRILLSFTVLLAVNSLVNAQSTLSIPDTRDVATTPISYSKLFGLNFKWSETIGLTGKLRPSFVTLMGMRGWLAGDDSGGKSHELAFTDDNFIFIRSGYSPRWEPWRRIITEDTSGNIMGGLKAIGALTSTIGGNDIGGVISIDNPNKTALGAASSWKIFNMTGSTYGNSLQFWAYDNKVCDGGLLCQARLILMDNGNVGIGASPGSYKLAVEGTIGARKIRVQQGAWSDFVFNHDYQLPTLQFVESYIKENKHLPDIPSEKEVMANGIDLGEMNNKLLRKVEELTLYIIEMKKEIEALKKKH
ncbi:hypothetical protein [Chitinophaga sp. 212800010-3]|uniref:hypothetical protein n=1 Tax=unclassified Chitinophaga TaxID=2619133 RepID=UPI002DE8BB9C|nr:hypothetical protein [Chitinophaga sp. 212800010-3]